MSDQTDVLRRIDFFQSLDQKVVSKLAQVCVEREYAKGECIVKQGESGLGLFFITGGRVNVEVERDGIKTIVATLQAENLLGELSLVDNKPRSASAICLEDTRCLLLTRDSFSKLLNKYPEIAIHMAKALAGRIRAADERIIQATEASAIPGAEGRAQARALATGSDKLPASDSDSSAKNKAADFLGDALSFLFMAKALTHFAAAIIGCPVEIRVENPGPKVAQAVIDGVKVALFPASEDQTIRIEAYDQGRFSASVLRPSDDLSEIRVSRFEGQLRRDERLFLHVPKDGPVRIQQS